MKIARFLVILFFIPSFALAGADIEPAPEMQEPVADSSVDQEGQSEASQAPLGFELPLQGERLPNESVHIAPFEMDPINETEELVITQYSGEEGCCIDIVVLTNSLDGWKVIDFSWGLEEGSSVEDFVKDLDGDGSFELVLDQIYKIEDGEVNAINCSAFDMIGPDKLVKRCTGL